MEDGSLWKWRRTFPEEYRYVLESLGSVYSNEAQARAGELSAEDRLRFHKEHSGPVMKAVNYRVGSFVRVPERFEHPPL